MKIYCVGSARRNVVSVMATFVKAFNAPDIMELGGLIKLDRPNDQTVTLLPNIMMSGHVNGTAITAK